MSKCNDAPDPVTTVHGIVTDGATGKPIPGLQLRVANTYDLTDASNKNYYAVTTNADGSYYLKFTPRGTISYTIASASSTVSNYFEIPPKITFGIDNDINIKLYDLLTLTVHLINNSGYGKTQFMLYVNDDFAFTSVFVPPPLKIDTTFKLQVSHLMTYTFVSTFLVHTQSIPLR